MKLPQSDKPLAILDVECYVDYFLLKVTRLSDGKVVDIEQYDGLKFDADRARKILNFHETVSFNGKSYDLIMIFLAMKGLSCEKLKEWSDRIILGNMRPWEVENEANFRIPKSLRHIDLIEVAPGQASLKIYGGRLHTRRMENLPIEPDERISPEQRKLIISYCGTDLQVTIDLAHELREQVELRCIMSNEYKGDLRSKSDAQVAEAVIKHEVEKARGGRKIKKPDLERPGPFYYKPPDFIEFRTANMQEVLRKICNIPLVIGRNGRVQKTEAFDELVFKIGNTSYKMGIGGLHSQEANRSIYSDDEYLLVDEDVTGYYPKLIINNNLIPPACGPVFSSIFSGIYERRVKAKRAKMKAIAETLKIVLNGTFGKLGQPFSIFYAPKQMVTVTITGQLSLLMAIERIEMARINVVSANTDGFTTKAILFDWECDTGFDLEEVAYKSMHNRSVNDYIAIPYTWDAENKRWDENKIDKPKCKGAYASPGPGIPAAMGLKKNPGASICTEAVIQYLSHGTPLEDTIEKCRDIRQFIAVRSVKGGGVWPRRDGSGIGTAEIRRCV